MALEGMIRVDDTAVHKAIREAVVNMIIHADYHSYIRRRALRGKKS